MANPKWTQNVTKNSAGHGYKATKSSIRRYSAKLLGLP